MIGGLVIIFVLMTPWSWANTLAAALFVIFSLTDWLDGYWARKYNCETNFGKLMDPVADKILVLGTLVMLLSKGGVDPLMVFLLLSRDLYVGGIRSVAAADRLVVAAKPFGKWKTALQMIAIPCLLIDHPILPDQVPRIAYLLLWASVGLSLISGVQYTTGYLRARRTV
jgi:CDP-diacylglycerol--glycerol-3-phosphate 3-phosphatidyltransferase